VIPEINRGLVPDAQNDKIKAVILPALSFKGVK
jgi:hypothetical protein